MSEESHLDEMNEAIRAQRERGAVPRSMLPPEDEPAESRAPVDEPPARPGVLTRLLRRDRP